MTKAAKVSPFLKGIKKLLEENMTFVDYNDERIAVKLPELSWLFRNIIQKRIDDHLCTRRLFFITAQKPSNILRLIIFLSNLIWKCTSRDLFIHISINIWSSKSSYEKSFSHTA